MTANEKTVLDVVLRIGERLGVPLLVLVAVMWMGREAGSVLYTTAIVPLVEAHGRFLESTAHNLEEIGTTQRQQTQTLQEIASGQKELAGLIQIKSEERN